MRSVIYYMSIETYTDGIMFLHLGLFICLVIAGIAVIWRKICGKKTKCWWLIPCAMYYSVFVVIGTFMASMAYDDPADPNFARYGNWELRNFILNDMGRLIVWLCIGLLFYLAFERKDGKKAVRIIGTQVMVVLTALFIMLMGMIVWSFIAFLQVD